MCTITNSCNASEKGLYKYKSTLNQDKSQVGIIDYKPHAFENPVCHVLSKRISFEAKIEPDEL
jgi:hypothetical protein